MFNPDTAPYVSSFYLPLFEAAASSLKLVLIAAPVHSDAEIETVIASLGARAGKRLGHPARWFHDRSPLGDYIASNPKQCTDGV